MILIKFSKHKKRNSLIHPLPFSIHKRGQNVPRSATQRLEHHKLESRAIAVFTARTPSRDQIPVSQRARRDSYRAAIAHVQLGDGR